MPGRIRRSTISLVAVAALGGCTFGKLKRSDCLSQYGPGLGLALAKAQAGGGVSEAFYAYCIDGRRRAEAMAAQLRAAGLNPTDLRSHFEVPGAWCLSTRRSYPHRQFSAESSLEQACALGEAGKAYLTGGTLRTAGGTEVSIRSVAELDYMREAGRTPD